MNSQPNHHSSAESINDMYYHLGLENNRRLYANGFYSMATIVGLNMAVSVMPRGLADFGLPGLSFIPIKNLNVPARTSIIYPRNRPIPAVRDLLALL